MELLSIFSLIRIVIYLWVGLEFGNLAFLYLVGYHKYKTTLVIRSLQVMLTTLSINFLCFAFLPVLFETNVETYTVAVRFLPFILIPVGFAVRWFRSESLKKQKMDLPKKNEG